MTVVACLSVLTCCTGLASDFNHDWLFYRGDLTEAQVPKYDDSTWRRVNLPHDYSIENVPGSNSPFSADSIDQFDTAYSVGGVGWYRKSFSLPADISTKVVWLEFDGIYMDSTVYVNGHKAGGQSYGYTAFQLDIGQYLHSGKDNVIAVRVNNPHLNSRWYSGSGIYRQVYLHILEPSFFALHGTTISSPEVSVTQARVAVKTRLENRSTATRKMTLNITIEDAQGEAVSEYSELVPFSATQQAVVAQMVISKAHLWSAQQPYLYRMRMALSIEGKLIDQQVIPFGIRDIKLDAQKGLLVNGESVVLKGMNLHHDNYMLGAAAWPAAELRKIKRIKAAGYNAIRTAHNPPSRALLDAADSVGLYVIDEAFDAWNQAKWDHVNDYSSHFSQDWQRDLSNFVQRDINHPSVIMWSIGNEIPEQTTELGVKTAAKLMTKVKQLDPSRAVTIGANVSGEFADDLLNQFDVVGYNYQPHNYITDKKRNPQRIMYGSETYSTEAFDYWQYVEQQPYVIGDFVWTGWDYLGEASIGWYGYGENWNGLGDLPWTLAYSGELDAMGLKRPAGFYRDLLWQTGNTPLSLFVKSPQPSLTPVPDPSRYLYWVQDDIHPSWTWPGQEGKDLHVVVYSDAFEVELSLNGQSLGRKKSGKINHYSATFTVPYQAGTLRAMTYDKAGTQLQQIALSTHSKAASVLLTAERTEIAADGNDLVYVLAQLQDDKGRPIYHWSEDKQLTFSLSGPGKIVGVGNAKPNEATDLQDKVHNTFGGKAMVVIQSKAGQAGSLMLTAVGGDISSNIAVINSQ